MDSWSSVISRWLYRLENTLDALKYRWAEWLGWNDPIMIQTYGGFGTRQRVFVKGRVLEDEGISKPGEAASLWTNLVDSFKRFESDEIPHASLLVHFQGVRQEVQADEEGFFEAWIEPAEALGPGKSIYPVEFELIAPLRPGEAAPRAEGQVFIPLPQARFGILSDLDDTVLVTEVKKPLRMAQAVFTQSARDRLAFEGVSRFYRALVGEEPTGMINPLFYISSSPWNLYDLIIEVFRLNEIPPGAMLFLRDWGLREDEFLPTDHHKHKLQAIETVLELYPELPILLIGDSGQSDPEVYAAAVEAFPGRIPAIYIREVTQQARRIAAIEAVAREVAQAGSELIVAESTSEMAAHAAAHEWITPEAAAQVRAAVGGLARSE